MYYYATYLPDISLMPYVLTLAAVLAVGIVVLSSLILRDADVPAKLARAHGRRLLSNTRLERMLRTRGVDLDAYVGAVPATEVRRQVAVCRACPHTRLCGEVLSAGEVGIGLLSFCPNVRAVDRFAQTVAQAA